MHLSRQKIKKKETKLPGGRFSLVPMDFSADKQPVSNNIPRLKQTKRSFFGKNSINTSFMHRCMNRAPAPGSPLAPVFRARQSENGAKTLGTLEATSTL